MIRAKSSTVGTKDRMLSQEVAQEDFRSKDIFDQIEAVLAEDGSALVGKVKGIYLFKVKAGASGAEGRWILDAKNGTGSVEFGGEGRRENTGVCY